MLWCLLSRCTNTQKRSSHQVRSISSVEASNCRSCHGLCVEIFSVSPDWPAIIFSFKPEFLYKYGWNCSPETVLFCTWEIFVGCVFHVHRKFLKSLHSLQWFLCAPPVAALFESSSFSLQSASCTWCHLVKQWRATTPHPTAKQPWRHRESRNPRASYAGGKRPPCGTDFGSTSLGLSAEEGVGHQRTPRALWTGEHTNSDQSFRGIPHQDSAHIDGVWFGGKAALVPLSMHADVWVFRWEGPHRNPKTLKSSSAPSKVLGGHNVRQRSIHPSSFTPKRNIVVLSRVSLFQTLFGWSRLIFRTSLEPHPK